MIIKKKRVRNLDGILGFVPIGAKVSIGIKNPDRFNTILTTIGFALPLTEGESILPPATLGPVSLRNTEGSEIIHKDRPMETVYRIREWSWTDWGGYEHTELVEVPYERYPRTPIPPFSVELAVFKNTKGELLLASQPTIFSEENKALITHTINLFLEAFGECEILSEDLNDLVKTQIRKLNWHILPVGRLPWEQLSKQLESLVNEAVEEKRRYILHRLEKVYSYSPDFTAVGTAGFKGYIVFGFPSKNLYICESIYYGNATYVFAEKWEELSKRTKAEILSGSLQKDRIIHRLYEWDRKIDKLLKKP